jgi:acetyl-CoA carboxylase carboxyltransferase component
MFLLIASVQWNMRGDEQGMRAEERVVVPQPSSAAPTVDDIAHRLHRLREVSTRPDFQAAARQHARGKLTMQEKLAVLFDPGSFVEDLTPHPDLAPRHNERPLVTGHGQNQGCEVTVAIFDASIAAGAVTIATVNKPITQMQRAEAQCSPRISGVIDQAFGGAYCAMDSIASSIRSRLCRHYGFTSGPIAVMGKEAGAFFTYGSGGRINPL